jgi:hypothetical protein
MEHHDVDDDDDGCNEEPQPSLLALVRARCSAATPQEKEALWTWIQTKVGAM